MDSEVIYKADGTVSMGEHVVPNVTVRPVGNEEFMVSLFDTYSVIVPKHALALTVLIFADAVDRALRIFLTAMRQAKNIEPVDED